MAIGRSQMAQQIMKPGVKKKPGLWANINRRKKLGISRSKKDSTITKSSWENMKAGFPKSKKKTKKT